LTAQDAVDVARSLTEQLRNVDAIGQETALVGKGAHRGDRRQLVARRQLDDALAMPHREWVRRQEQRTTRLSRKPPRYPLRSLRDRAPACPVRRTRIVRLLTESIARSLWHRDYCDCR